MNFIMPIMETLPSGEIVIDGLAVGWAVVASELLSEVMDWSMDGRFWPYYISDYTEYRTDYAVRFVLQPKL